MTIEKRTADLTTLADKVNAEHRACEEAVGAALRHAITAGELLTEAKASVSHGSWGSWLAENFEGSERTAQAYMKVYRRRDEIRNGAADSSLRGALKELATPTGVSSDSGGDPEEAAETIRGMMKTFGPQLSEEERDAFERRLLAPGSEEDKLLRDIQVEDLYLLAAQVQVDGIVFEDGDDGESVMTYRSEDKTKIFRVPLPAAEEHRERVRRASRQYALSHFNVWRLLSNWLTKVLVAHSTDFDVIEERVQHNADWRKAEPAAKYLREELFHQTDKRRFAEDRGMRLGELEELLGGVKVWINVRALRWERVLMADNTVNSDDGGAA